MSNSTCDAYSVFIKLGDRSSRILMRARISFGSKEIADGPSRATSVSAILASWTFGIWESLRARCTGRNPDRGREALSPRGVLYAWTWSEMARESTPRARGSSLGERPFLGSASPSSAVLLAAQIVSKMTVPGSAFHARIGRRKRFPCVAQDTTANFRCGRP